MIDAAQQIPCLVCRQALTLRLARGRKSGKPFVMLICPADGRHFRGFITDQGYVRGVLSLLEDRAPSLGDEGGPEGSRTYSGRSNTDLYRDSRS